MKRKVETRGRILMIGKRKGAVAAARRCGWEPIVINLHSRGEQAPGAFGGSTAWAVELANEFFPDQPPASVVAVATGSVVAAAAIRAHFGLPGIGTEVARRCHDKLVMKKAVVAAGIPCADWVETREGGTARELIGQLGLPLVLKMPISSGGRGVWLCHTESEVAAQLRPGLLAEGFVTGAEMSVETFRAGGRTLFRNPTRYLLPRWANVVPADLGPAELEQVDDLAERVHQALEIHDGISHMELFLTAHGPVFGEIAARPPGGYLMELMRRAYGFDPWESLIRLATGESPEFPAQAIRHAGVWIIHPGPGTVRVVRGLEDAAAIPGVIDASCRLRAGEVVGERLGSGDQKGRIVVEHATNEGCADTLTRALQAIQISLIPAPGSSRGDRRSGGGA